jgi:hypothetical protein
MSPKTLKAPKENGTIILKYIGKMEWAKEFGIDSRMWNVVSPKLKGYDYSSGGEPTFTLEGLKERRLI